MTEFQAYNERVTRGHYYRFHFPGLPWIQWFDVDTAKVCYHKILVRIILSLVHNYPPIITSCKDYTEPSFRDQLL